MHHIARSKLLAIL